MSRHFVCCPWCVASHFSWLLRKWVFSGWVGIFWVFSGRGVNLGAGWIWGGGGSGDGWIWSVGDYLFWASHLCMYVHIHTYIYAHTHHMCLHMHMCTNTAWLCLFLREGKSKDPKAKAREKQSNEEVTISQDKQGNKVVLPSPSPALLKTYLQTVRLADVLEVGIAIWLSLHVWISRSVYLRLLICSICVSTHHVAARSLSFLVFLYLCFCMSTCLSLPVYLNLSIYQWSCCYPLSCLTLCVYSNNLFCLSIPLSTSMSMYVSIIHNVCMRLHNHKYTCIYKFAYLHI